MADDGKVATHVDDLTWTGDQWEYEIGRKLTKEQADAMGSQGWEMVNAFPTQVNPGRFTIWFVFKRRLMVPVPPYVVPDRKAE